MVHLSLSLKRSLIPTSEMDSHPLALIPPILAQVLTYCDLPTLCSASRVCKQWRAVFERIPKEDLHQFVSVLANKLNTMAYAWWKENEHPDELRSQKRAETLSSLSRFLSKHRPNVLTRAEKDFYNVKEALKSIRHTGDTGSDGHARLPKALSPALDALVYTCLDRFDPQTVMQFAEEARNNNKWSAPLPFGVDTLLLNQDAEFSFGSFR